MAQTSATGDGGLGCLATTQVIMSMIAGPVRTVCMVNDMDVSLAFSHSELQTLRQCEDFANALLKITSDLRKGADTSEKLPLPPFPKADLLKMMTLDTKPDKTLRGEELHAYLNSKIVSADAKPDEITLPPQNININKMKMKDVLPGLKKGYLTLQKISAKTLHFCLNYGAWLNTAFKVYKIYKARGLVKDSWAKWLRINVGVSDSYARKLRELSTEFINYKTIHNLSIPFSELWNRRLEISHMLNTHPDIAKYWLGV